MRYIRMKTFYLLLASCIVLFPACTSGVDESQTNEIDKGGAVEISYSTQTVGKVVVAKTERKFWVNGSLYKADFTLDTLPQLPISQEWGEDKDGNEKQINVQKEYQFYITIK